MKNYLPLLFIAILLFLSPLRAQNNQNIFNEDELKFIQNNPHFSVAMMNNFKPFSFIEQNTHQGLSLDILKQISHISGINFQAKTSLWNKALKEFKKGNIPVIADISHTTQRESFTLFSQAYYEISTYLFGLKKDTHYKNIYSLKGKKVAISKSIYYKKQLEDLGVEVVEVLSSDEKAKLLALGKVDYFLASFTSGKKAIVTQSLTNIKPIEEFTSIKKEDLRFGVSPKLPLLHSIINKSLKAISSQAKAKLSDKWIMQLKEVGQRKLNLNKQERAYIQSKTHFNVCFDPNWAPIEYAHNKNYKDIRGIAFDTIKLAFSYINKPIKIVPSSTWEEAIDNFTQKRCDVLSAVSIYNFNHIDALYTKPYLNFPLAIFTTKDKPLIRNPIELNGKTWSRQEHSGLIKLIEDKYPKYKTIQTKDNVEALELVSKGKVDFTIATLPTAYHTINQYMLDNLKVTGYTNLDYPLSVAINKQEPMLFNIVSKLMEHMNEDEKYNIFNRWVHQPNPIEEFDLAILFHISAVALMIILGLLYKQYILNKANITLEKKVTQKTKELSKINKTLEKRIKKEIERSSKKDKLLAHQSKMIALGEMLENIAHQWRQPLSVIGTSITGLKVNAELENTITNDYIIETADIINQQTHYLSKTIDDFRNYFCDNSESQEEFNLKELIQHMQSLTQDSLKNNYIKTIVSLKDCTVVCNQNLLMQALINIYNNAKDAMIQQKDDSQHRVLFITLTFNHKDVILQIRDSGGGIKEEILEKVFEPYFTTKHQSVGTGLGLYMSHQIITKQLLGTINVQNTEYLHDGIRLKGAEFTITLPLIKTD